ncbi:retrotransposon protein, putative, ty1-copia subclass [Tanacetum coccineum]|uniref:Retrotransposon protein, putative, ty1-copia subclass n=1 Tax=Tanacetum coccineum TaxID=301880 RepID=A0ABQ4XK86_9ASTR
MKSYLDTLERLGYAIPKVLGVSLILNSLNKDYDQFVQKYNMHSIGKMLAELHAMLKLHEKGIPKKVETPTMLAIWEGRIQKDKKKKLQGAKGKGKGKNKLAYDPKPKIPPLSKKEHPKRKNASVASTSSIFTIELYDFPNKTWVYDTGCGTHICNTSQGLRESRKLNHGALSMYMGNGMRPTVEAIRSFDLILPSDLIVVLDNCHFTPTVTRGVVLNFCLVNNGYIQTFTNYGISVSKNNAFYFNAIPCDGIYEIDIHNLYPNVSSIYNVSNKRAKHGLDSYYLRHYGLGHINKKCMDMLQRDGLLQPTHDELHEKCKSYISGKMARNPFPHQVERAKDLLGLIHTNVCGSFRIVSREGASYFITFTYDFSRHGFAYLMKHKQELFETFKGYKALVKRDTPDKLDSRSIKCIFVGYPKEMMGYYFYYPLKNKTFISRNTKFFENSFMGQEASKSHGLLEMSGSDKGLELIQEEDTHPFENTRKEHTEIAPTEVESQKVRVPIRRSARIPQVPDRYGYYVDIEEYELGDLNEPPNYNAALVDPESNKWLEAMNTEMQSINDNQVWYLVDLPSNG